MGLKPLPTLAEFVPKMLVRTWPFMAGSLLFGVPLVIKARNTSRTFPPVDLKRDGSHVRRDRGRQCLRARRPMHSPLTRFDLGCRRFWGEWRAMRGEEVALRSGAHLGRGADGLRAS
jgi:hypothetical protein